MKPTLLLLKLKISSNDSVNSEGDLSVEESQDRLASLSVGKPLSGTFLETPNSYEETLEFVDSSVTPTSLRRRRSSLVRRFSVGSFADSVKIELGEASADEPESVVYTSGDSPKICDFVPVTVLGQGAYGKVLLVRHRSTGKLFAQKQLKKASILISAKNQSSLVKTEQENIDKKIERTMAERDILAKIRHQFIVKLFYALQDSNKIYLYLGFVPGGELFHHLNTSAFFDERATSFYSAEMALALHHLHTIGVVYRDLKPENCLLDSDGHLVLTDFGLSKISTVQDSRCNSIIGTPEYMAPEVLRGEDYSFGVDWWSLGTVIFDMLSGKPPFTGNNHKTISNKILKNKVNYPFYFTAESKDLLNKLLNKNPQKRMDVDGQFEKFKKLRFFRHTEWDKLSDETVYKQVKAPIVPTITNEVLAENFDEEFTSMKISNYDLENGSEIIVQEEFDDEMFNGFSYTASSSYIEKFL